MKGLSPGSVRINKIVIFLSMAVIFGIVAVLSYFTYTYNATSVSLQENVYGLNELKKDLEQELTIFENENMELKAKADVDKREKEELNKKILELETKLKELEEQNKLLESASFSPIKPRQKMAYLTFDDGPSSNTGKILDVLKKYGVKATFFVNGNESMTDTYKKIVEEGHIIGNHSYSHDYEKIYTTEDDFFADYDRLDTFLKTAVGYESSIFRFPGGSKNSAAKKYGNPDIMQKIITALEGRGVKYFDWNVTSADADISGKAVDKDIIVKNILSGAQYKRNAIILMHDRGGKETTIEALPEVIEGLSEQGFKFGVLSKYVNQ